MKKAFLVLIMMAGLILFSSSVVKAAMDDSLVLYLSLGEGNGEISRDRSGYGNDATLNGGALWTKDGKYGDAIVFDGVDDGLAISDVDSIDLGGQLTLEAWVYPHDVSGAYKGIISKEDWNNAKGYFLGQNNKQIYLGFNKGVKNEIQGGKFDTNEKWYHVAGTFDSSLNSNNLKIYIDGDLAKEGGNSEVPIAHSATLDIGWIHDLAESYFAGIIDEVAIYSRTLTEAEIKEDMIKGPVSDVAPSGKLATAWAKIKSY